MIFFFFTVFPDDGEPAPNIEEYSSISNYDDYDGDTNSSTAFEWESFFIVNQTVKY